jgi:hypothetical protein
MERTGREACVPHFSFSFCQLLFTIFFDEIRKLGKSDASGSYL